MDVWPGHPFPLGPTWDGNGTNFALFSENAERVELCLFDAEDDETRVELAEHTAFNWHCYIPGRRPRPALRLSRPRPVRPRGGPPLQPGEAPHRPVREGDRRARRSGIARTCCRTCRAATRTPISSSTTRTTTAAIPKCVVIDPSFDWEDDRPPDASVVGDRHLRGARQGLHEAASGSARGSARHVRRPRLRAGARVLQAARRDGGRAAADPSHRRRELPARARADELLGLLVDRLPRAARALRRDGHARRAGARVQGDGQGAARGRHRGDPRRRLQPHRRGQPPRADALVQGRRQRELLPADAGRAALLHGLHRHGQLAQPGAPVGAAADHGLAALLRDRLPRRRVPLRPRVGARARVLRRRPALGVLRHDPPGSGALAGEADRRAVGRRARRLPGRQLPGAVGGVERHLPRHDARLLARAGERRRLRVALHRLERSLPGRRPHAVRRRSTSSPRTTASRCAISSRTTRSTTRRTARTTRTAPTTTARGTAASRVRPTIPPSTRCARGSSGTS